MEIFIVNDTICYEEYSYKIIFDIYIRSILYPDCI